MWGNCSASKWGMVGVSTRGSRGAVKLWLLCFWVTDPPRLPDIKPPMNLKGLLICLLISTATTNSEIRHTIFDARIIPRIKWVNLFCFFTFLISSITSSIFTCPPISSLPWSSVSEFLSSVGKLFSQSFWPLSAFNEFNCKKETQQI